MPKYGIERDIPSIGNVAPDQVIAIPQKSFSVLNNLGPQIQWLHRYVTQDNITASISRPTRKWSESVRGNADFPQTLSRK